MISFPKCKINIGLNIHHKREDNYHEISSVMYPVPWYDVLEIVPSNSFKFTHSGLEIPGSSDHNLCIRAYELLSKEYKVQPVHAHLRKNIPMGGGLGGGSSDATAMLKMLNQYNKLGLTRNELKNFAVQLGADCAFFIDDEPQFATGIGEELSPINLDLSDYHLLLINDGTHVSTKEAYANISPQKPIYDLKRSIEEPVKNWKYQIINQFEESVFRQFPHLSSIKQRLTESGALYSSMTGSGATMYGLFDNKPEDWKNQFRDMKFAKLIEL